MTHRSWGLFRSMWPASVLVDHRLDRQDKDTRAWLKVFAILCVGCIFVSSTSLYFLFEHTSTIITNVKGFTTMDSEALLKDIVLWVHAVVIFVFLMRAIINMFYFKFN